MPKKTSWPCRVVAAAATLCFPRRRRKSLELEGTLTKTSRERKSAWVVMSPESGAAEILTLSHEEGEGVSLLCAFWPWVLGCRGERVCNGRVWINISEKEEGEEEGV